jgi:hypothetical protein
LVESIAKHGMEAALAFSSRHDGVLGNVRLMGKMEKRREHTRPTRRQANREKHLVQMRDVGRRNATLAIAMAVAGVLPGRLPRPENELYDYGGY